MVRKLSDKDIKELDSEHVVDRRKGDRRKAINSYIDPEHDRRIYNRRSDDRKKVDISKGIC